MKASLVLNMIHECSNRVYISHNVYYASIPVAEGLQALLITWGKCYCYWASVKTFLERWLIESPNSALVGSAYEDCSESCLFQSFVTTCIPRWSERWDCFTGNLMRKSKPGQSLFFVHLVCSGFALQDAYSFRASCMSIITLI